MDRRELLEYAGKLTKFLCLAGLASKPLDPVQAAVAKAFYVDEDGYLYDWGLHAPAWTNNPYFANVQCPVIGSKEIHEVFLDDKPMPSPCYVVRMLTGKKGWVQSYVRYKDGRYLTRLWDTWENKVVPQHKAASLKWQQTCPEKGPRYKEQLVTMRKYGYVRYVLYKNPLSEFWKGNFPGCTKEG